MDVLQSSASRRVFGPAEDLQRRRRERQKQAAELAAAAAAADARGMASKGEASFFKESEETRHQLCMLALLTDQAAAEAAGDFKSAREAAAAAAAAARSAIDAGAATPCAEDVLLQAETESKRAEGKIGAALSSGGVGLWLRRFCGCASGVSRTLEFYLEQPALLDAHLRDLVASVAVPLRRHLRLFLPQTQQRDAQSPVAASASVAAAPSDGASSNGVVFSWQLCVARCCVQVLLHVVYVLCKVVGAASVRSLLPQEPMLLHLLLDCLEEQVRRDLEPCDAAGSTVFVVEAPFSAEEETAFSAVKAVASEVPQWSATFSLFVWLSLLARTPFPLETLEPQAAETLERGGVADSPDPGPAQELCAADALQSQRLKVQRLLEKENQAEAEASKDARSLGGRFLAVSFLALKRSSKAAEGAALLLQAFFSRADLKESERQRLLLRAFIRHCEELLLPTGGEREALRGDVSAKSDSLFSGEHSNGAPCSLHVNCAEPQGLKRLSTNCLRGPVPLCCSAECSLQSFEDGESQRLWLRRGSPPGTAAPSENAPRAVQGIGPFPQVADFQLLQTAPPLTAPAHAQSQALRPRPFNRETSGGKEVAGLSRQARTRVSGGPRGGGFFRRRGSCRRVVCEFGGSSRSAAPRGTGRPRGRRRTRALGKR